MTTESENINMVVSALKKVPEKKLMIIEMANSIPIKHGELDPEELDKIKPRINLAIAEAESYGTHTIMAVDALARLKARSEQG